MLLKLGSPFLWLLDAMIENLVLLTTPALEPWVLPMTQTTLTVEPYQ